MQDMHGPAGNGIAQLESRDQHHAEGRGPLGRLRGRLRDAWADPRRGLLVVGAASLLWLLLRTGTKPSRAAYPCQRAALANASALLGVLGLPALLGVLGLPTPRALAARTTRKGRLVLLLLAAAVLAAVSAGIGASLGTRAAAERQVSIQLAENRVGVNGYSDIVAIQGTSGADRGFQQLVELMERNGPSFYSLIGPRDVVIIKVNSQWDERGGTNTDLVKAMIQGILDHPRGFEGEIVIADNGQAQAGSTGTGGSLDWKSGNAEDRSQSMQKVADGFPAPHRVSTALWDRITTIRVSEYSEGDARDGYVVDPSPSPRTGIDVSYPKFKTRYSTLISFKKGIWNPARKSYDSERLKVINVPVLKSHIMYGVTACVKHYMGVASEKLTHSAHGSVGQGGMGTEMAQTRIPVLNVIDAIWVNAAPGRGPQTRYSDATRVGIIAAGRDPVALDYWAAKNILLPAAAELGFKHTLTMDPDAAKSGFGRWLRLSMDELQLAGFTATIDLDRVNITVSSVDELPKD